MREIYIKILRNTMLSDDFQGKLKKIFSVYFYNVSNNNYI